MISLEQLKRHYDLDKAQSLISKPEMKLLRTVRKSQRSDQERSKPQEVVIKTMKGLEIRLDNAKSIVEDIGRIINGVLAYHCAQSDLCVKIEDFCLAPSKGLGQQNILFLDQIIVLEYFGKDLSKSIKSGENWTEENIDKLVRFLIRALRMMKQRRIVHGDIKPANIVRDSNFNFKLIDFDGSGFYRSEATITKRSHTEAYASLSIKYKMLQGEEISAEEWRMNDNHCAAMAIIQVVKRSTTDQLKKYGANKASLRNEVLNNIPRDFPNIGRRLKEVLEMLIEGKDIDEIARVYGGNDPILYLEDFGMIRDKKLENELVNAMATESLDDSIRKTITYLVKGVDLNSVKETLSSNFHSNNVKEKRLSGEIKLKEAKFLNFKTEDQSIAVAFGPMICPPSPPSITPFDEFQYGQLNRHLQLPPAPYEVSSAIRSGFDPYSQQDYNENFFGSVGLNGDLY
eukprot:TRINITY_DN1576_c0_g2_i1.p1 TRINITY_DN1576_c0_g2~~TRINITY_DN1576_c0_g2_i1.p1  ORF type:complete len:457 (-),score=59.73 TRINITY_DN1576_c0_g2_i1:95-1465(-)